MDPFTPATFGELNAKDYDAVHDPGTTEASVALISDLAGTGRILELAIGTGRVALPLAARGHDIAGIEGSPEMVAKLREKPGGGDIDVVIGDMADVGMDGPFDHVFLVFNTLFNLQSQADQVRCFQNVADRLAPGGTFLIEAFVPDFSGFTDNQRVTARNLTQTGVWLDACTHDPVAQLLEFQRIRMTDQGLKLVPLRLRYACPPELDLMAQMAGLTRAHRWGGWGKDPFDAHSRMHVSVYQKPA
ncbi:class I SAM-dependent methyltransferase [Tateyamaria sp. SN3-11]|uniref:class I SAM-dependent methyltransferase n=1 Tax=Tateyamaria sp. SN3-11 TaxID=3092147 RepID=UPI0039ED36A9